MASLKFDLLVLALGFFLLAGCAGSNSGAGMNALTELRTVVKRGERAKVEKVPVVASISVASEKRVSQPAMAMVTVAPERFVTYERLEAVAEGPAPIRATNPIFNSSRGPASVAAEMVFAQQAEPPPPVPVAESASAHLAVAAEDPAVAPQFPWPPPQPSEQAEIPATLFKRHAGDKLRSLGAQLASALVEAGYTSNKYFRLPGPGFAIATGMERYESDGRSSEEPNRWVVTDSPQGSFGLSRFLRTLFTGKTGQYRLFVLVVTDGPFGTDPNQNLSSAEADHLMAVGWNGLPKAIADSEWGEDVSVHALVYEFEKREGLAPEVRKPVLKGEAHLKASRILATLTP